VSRVPFVYSVLRVVPRVDRGECMNVGVLLYCQQRDHLELATHVDGDRLRALDPRLDVRGVEEALEAVHSACDDRAAGSAREGGGLGSVFRWLTAPRSTVLQPGPVHGGLTDDPAAEVRRLLERLVR
jgi:hypothetical protein